MKIVYWALNIENFFQQQLNAQYPILNFQYSTAIENCLLGIEH